MSKKRHTFATDSAQAGQISSVMIGKPTSCKPVRGAIAKEIHEHLERVAAEKKQGTAKRAYSLHKTSIELAEV